MKPVDPAPLSEETSAEQPQLHAIHLDGYKCFARREGLTLRPLTLLYGRNNAGKSSLLRALAILGRSVAESAASPWDMGGDLGPGRGAAFKDLAWRGRKRGRSDFELILEWRTGDAASFDRFRLDQDEDAKPAFVREVWVDLPAIDVDRREAAAGWVRVPPAEGERAQYERAADERSVAVPFEGLVPVAKKDPQLGRLAERLRSLRNAVQWLHGSRSPAPRDVPLSGAAAPSLEPDGSNAALKLIIEQEQLLDDVRAFYADPCFDRELSIDHYRVGGARLLLDRIGEPYRIQLADVGEGMGKVLPVLVAVAAAVRGRGPRLVVIEDPDVHLHDDGVRVLVEWIAARLADNPDVRVVFETHSETVKLATQNAIRQGMLTPEQLGFVWCERQGDGHTSAKRVGFDRRGQPTDSTLRSTFMEGQRLAAELAGLYPAAGHSE